MGRILLMETVTACHQGQMAPLVVLYDTSQDEDLNINAACLKALRDLAPQDHAPLAVSRGVSQILHLSVQLAAILVVDAS